VEKRKEETVHISANVAPEVAKAAKIQAIKDGMSLQAWISQAIMRRLAAVQTIPESEQEPPKGASKK
jgi:predicted HicB family RNase H-like nuclease